MLFSFLYLSLHVDNAGRSHLSRMLHLRASKMLWWFHEYVLFFLILLWLCINHWLVTVCCQSKIMCKTWGWPEQVWNKWQIINVISRFLPFFFKHAIEYSFYKNMMASGSYQCNNHDLIYWIIKGKLNSLVNERSFHSFFTWQFGC